MHPRVLLLGRAGRGRRPGSVQAARGPAVPSAGCRGRCGGLQRLAVAQGCRLEGASRMSGTAPSGRETACRVDLLHEIDPAVGFFLTVGFELGRDASRVDEAEFAFVLALHLSMIVFGVNSRIK